MRYGPIKSVNFFTYQINGIIFIKNNEQLDDMNHSNQEWITRF